MNKPTNIEEAAECVRSSETVLVCGAETKRPQEESAAARLSVKKLSGIVEYEPSEYTFTALAGTSLSEIEEALCANGQYLPFDPPLVGAGATLGGTVASGLSGPGRLRYGGLRDFLIGARFINGAGQIIQGGGKVVKNAAGFDYPKLLCGSMSTLGAIVETTFKVFPRPRSKRTLELTFPNLDKALEKIHEITISKWEPDALELIPTKNQILLRLAGNEDALKSRLPAILEQLKDCTPCQIPEDEANSRWTEIQEFSWTGDEDWILKVPITPSSVMKLESQIREIGVKHHYSIACNLVWIASNQTEDLTSISSILERCKLTGVLVRGVHQRSLYGFHRKLAIHDAIKQTMDSEGKFPDLL